MKVAVLGLWHLGSVTAACLAAAGHSVSAFDPAPGTVAALAAGRLPVAEPGLAELITRGIQLGALRFTSDLPAAVRDAEVVWITFDTPVDEDDVADVAFVERQVEAAFPYLAEGSVVLCSSQLPVGTIGRLEQAWLRAAGGRTVSFACSPENLRLGKAIDVFTNPDRIIVGVRDDRTRARVQALLQPITDRIEWMSVESAEMTKHAVNAFLATSVTFINELAALCERTGADAKEVERGLKTERRIGPHAYLSPGGAFAGGTLARDVTFLRSLGSDAWPAHAAHGRCAREQHSASHVGATPTRIRSGESRGCEDRSVGSHLQAWHRHASPVRRRRIVPVARESGRLGARPRSRGAGLARQISASLVMTIRWRRPRARARSSWRPDGPTTGTSPSIGWRPRHLNCSCSTPIDFWARS